jgi:hypothetical protein
MTLDFHKIIQDHVRLQDNITIVDDIQQLKIGDIKDGVIMVWVNWSIGYLNCKYSIEYLQSKNYQGQIYIVDTDSIQADTRKNIFKSKLNGWGEIFVIKSGQITDSFVGKESFVAFKTYVDKIAGT